MKQYWKQFKYTMVAASGLLRKHSLKLPQQKIEYKTQFRLTESEVTSWMNFYVKHSPDHGRPQGDFPFFFFEPVGAESFQKILSGLGVNFKNILNLQTEFEFSDTMDQHNPLKTEYNVVTSLQDLFEFDDKNRCVAQIVAKVFAPQEEIPLMKATLHFLIKNVPQKDLEVLRSTVSLWKNQRNFTFNSKPASTLSGKQSFKNEMLFSRNMGLEYGMISGDMNIVHTNWALSRLFGFKKPFIQGLCVANYALYKLGKREMGGLKTFKIQFSRPVFLDQTVQILYTDRGFEILDANNKILCHGEFARHSVAALRAIG